MRSLEEIIARNAGLPAAFTVTEDRAGQARAAAWAMEEANAESIRLRRLGEDFNAHRISYLAAWTAMARAYYGPQA